MCSISNWQPDQRTLHVLRKFTRFRQHSKCFDQISVIRRVTQLIVTCHMTKITWQGKKTKKNQRWTELTQERTPQLSRLWQLQDLIDMASVCIFAIFVLLGGISSLPQSDFVVRFDRPSEKSTWKGCLVRRTPRNYPARWETGKSILHCKIYSFLSWHRRETTILVVSL